MDSSNYEEENRTSLSINQAKIVYCYFLNANF